MRVIVISCSLNPDSRSAVLAARAVEHLKEAGQAVELVDLRTQPIPFCDGCDATGDPAAVALTQKVRDADAILMAVPIYNFDANAAAKNLIELTGKAWNEKVVGFLCAAGGRGSYMSIMPLANSLMLDFRCLIVPRFVYATDADFEGAAPTAKVDERIAELCARITRLAAAVLDGERSESQTSRV